MDINRKIVIIGDGGVGKSTFLKHFRTKTFEKKYLATIGVEAHPLYAKTIENNDNLTLQFWDCAGQEKFAGLRDGYYIGADAAIVMFNLAHRNSFKNLCYWVSEFNRVCPNKPVIIVATKADEARSDLLRRAQEENFTIISTKEHPENNREVIQKLAAQLNLDIKMETLAPCIGMMADNSVLSDSEPEDFVAQYFGNSILDYGTDTEDIDELFDPEQDSELQGIINADLGLNSTMLLRCKL